MKRRIATCVASFVVLASAASAQTLVRSVPGPGANASFGKACITIADQNADGFDDLLVGAPGFNSGRGAVYCVSGGYLASGSGSSILWSIQPSANPGDSFGFALCATNDLTGDGVTDYLVGQPGYDNGTTQDVGAVRLINGITHAVLSLVWGPGQTGKFGSSIASCGDWNGDGLPETAVGAPGGIVSSGRVRILSGNGIQFSGSSDGVLYGELLGSPGIELGATLAGGFDLDANGYQDVAVGFPGYGGVAVLGRNATGQLTTLASHSPAPSGDRMGASLDAAADYDGDGVVDIVVGAPNWLDGNGRQAGRVVVLSGARLAAVTPPYEIYTLYPTASSLVFDFHFGTAVRASGDLNHDGVGEILVGAPNYSTSVLNGFNRGFVSIFSGRTGAKFCSIVGGHQDYFGDSIIGAFQDLGGDGFKELVFAGSLSDAGGTDSGALECYRLFPVPPASYCTGKINSLGCTPAMASSGSPSASSLAPFLINASNFLNQKSGLLFYSHSPSSAAFQGGVLCVSPPTLRTPQQSSGGSASGSDCTGSYSFDFNARIASGVDASLVAGAEIYAQYWSRDPQSPSTTSLSNALRFLISP
jgi:hypothetical protein